MMSDEPGGPQAPTAGEIPAPEEKSGFLKTPGGRLVAIVVGLGVLGIVAGIVVAIVLVGFGGQAAEDAIDEIGQQVAENTQPSSGSVTAKAEAPATEVVNAEVFTFRDIFVPLLKPLADSTAPTTGTTTTTTTDTVTPTTQNTLYLDGVVTQDGVLMAQLRYNGTSYTLGVGGTIPNSPWQVLRVSSTSVTMLYGDIQVTLSVGEGVTK